MLIQENNDSVDVGLGTIFSGLFLLGLNVAMAGYLLGKIFELDNSEKNFFNLRLPVIFKFQINGQEVIAGFISFFISFAFVGWVLHEEAKILFINNLEFATHKAIACELFATLLILGFCFVAGFIKIVIMFFWTKSKLKQKEKEDDPNKIVEELTEKDDHE